MTVPETRVGKILVYLIFATIVIIPFSAFMIYKKIEYSCYNVKPKQEEKKKSNKTLIFFIILLIFSGLAAQAINYSYSFVRYVPT